MIQALLRAASALAIVAATPAFAQDASPAEGSDDIVVTAQADNQTQVLRRGQVGILGDKDAADVPFSIKSYNAALILNQQPQTLGQVLENDPSIRTTYGFGNASEQFVIRGFTLFGDDIGLDGLYGITPRQLIAPELYEQVQVLNGASAFLNGALPGGSGLGGSVNLIPKRAGDRDLTRATANYTEGSHFGGAVDVSRRFGADGTWGIRLNGAYRAGDVSVDDEFRRSAVVGGAFDYRGQAVRLSLDLGYQKVRVEGLRPKVTVGTAIPAVPRASHNYAQAFTYTDLRDVFGTARAEWDVADNAMLYAAFGARDGAERGIYDGITVTDVATGAATGGPSVIPRTDNNEAAQAGIRVRLAGAGITHEFNIGGSHIWQVNRNAYDFRTGYATNLYATPAVALPQTSTFIGGDLTDPFPISRVRLGSAFASDTIGLFGDRVLVTGGLRLQTIDVRSYSYTDGELATRYDEDAATPVVGVVVKPVAGLSLYANRIEALQQGPTAPLDATLVNAGEIFSPYKSTQYEIGGKLAVGRFTVSLAGYTTTRPSAYAVAIGGGSLLQRYGLFGEQRNRGVELGLDGELTRGLRLIAGASYTDATLRDQQVAALNGKRAQGVPDWLANANVEWDLPFLRGLTLTGRVVYTGEQQVNAANTLTLNDWTRFDAGARFVAAVGDTPLTLRLNVDNLANKRYWASAFDTFSQTLLQGAPRTVKASVSVDF